MAKFQCRNCHLEFDSAEARQCPRCSSAQIFSKREKELTPASVQGASETPVPPKRFTYSPLVTDTKESWMKFHNNVDTQQLCPACGGKEFEYIWKRKEKVCKKCGEIQPLRRR